MNRPNRPNRPIAGRESKAWLAVGAVDRGVDAAMVKQAESFDLEAGVSTLDREDTKTRTAPNPADADVEL